MKVKEINRLLEYLDAHGYSTQDAAGYLDYVIVDNPEFDENEDAAAFESSMQMLFPDPVARASILKRLVFSSCLEEDENGEGSIALESNYYLRQMLSSIAALFEQADSIETVKEQFKRMIDGERQSR